MIVLDASAVVEVLISESPSPLLLQEFTSNLHAPAHLDVEVMSMIRGLTMGKKLSAPEAEAALAEFRRIPISRHPLDGLSERMWALRHQFTSDDAAYVALAEALHAPLVTCDVKLNTNGHQATVRVAPQG